MFANLAPDGDNESYSFKYPNNLGMIEQIMKSIHRQEEPWEFLGMNPDLEDTNKNLIFDSSFESGNLDMVTKVKDFEYDLYMRVDTNTKGHH